MISIVTTYFNRRAQFINTLKSIEKSASKDIELIAVDDASDEEHRIDDLQEEFGFLKVIRIDPEEKWYINPCIPFNLAIQKSIGDIVILQNPECMHVHDIVTYLKTHVDETNYICISTYAANEATTKRLTEVNTQQELLSLFESLPQRQPAKKGDNGWYNHSIYRPRRFHFCSGISRRNIDILGGFDERFAMGISFDDVDFRERVKAMNLNILIADDVSVVHQYHPPFYYQRSGFDDLHKKNRELYQTIHKS